MANVKISQLPAATQANAADELPANQAGTTRKVTASQLRAGLAASGANSDITALSGLTTALSVAQGGTGATTAGAALAALGGLPVTGGTLTGPTVVSTNSASDALRITQTGTGNALVVEDSANPDATPFVVDTNGRVLSGATASYAGIFGNAGNVQISSTSLHGLQSGRFANDAFGSDVQLVKSRSTTIGAQAVVQNGDSLGNVLFGGSDGIAFLAGAIINAAVDGTPGTNDMPGRLVFSTTADGASSPTERMRITNAGNVGVGGIPNAGRNFALSSPITGSTVSRAYTSIGTIQSDVTGTASYFATSANTAAASFTLGDIRHYAAIQGAFGAGSTVTNQFGFIAEPSLVGATNNFGFYSGIAAGTGRWNFYADGTANNYFAGNVGIGTTTPTATLNVVANSSSDAVRITQTGAGNALVVEDSANPDATPFVVDANGNVAIGTSVPSVYGAQFVLQGSASTGPIVVARNSTNDTSASNWFFDKDRAGAVVQSNDALGLFRFRGFDGSNFRIGAEIQANVDGTPGTNDMPGRLVFSTTADGASSPTERMRIDNAGRVGIGGVTPTARLTVVDATSQDAVRITQTGTGNALVVEDSTNPDATPFMVDASGNTGIGIVSGFANVKLAVAGGADGTANAVFARYSNDVSSFDVRLYKTRSTNIYVPVIVQSNDTLGGVSFFGDDGAGGYVRAATIRADVDGTPGVGDMPGRLVFLTTADGASNPTERMRIDAAGNVGVGTSSPVNRLQVNGSFGRGAPVTKTGNFTLADTENWLICNGAGSITVTFPAASSWTGREVMIKTIAAQTVVSASSNVVPINSATAGTAILPATAGAWATLVSDGTNWIIMQS